MSDFLVHFRPGNPTQRLLPLLKRPYGRVFRDGWCFTYPWGAAAILAEPLENGANIIRNDGYVIAWVGELIAEKTTLFREVTCALHQGGGGEAASALWRRVGEHLDGAFALLLLDDKRACVITDVTNSVRVYAGYARTGELCALGTHQDMVALLADRTLAIDRVSAVEFLSSGGVSFPHTMYEQVRRLEPASVHEFAFGQDGSRCTRVFPYWQPPAELTRADESELADELRAALVAAVEKRCQGKRIAVSLSGGLDSRLIMALVPPAVECIGVTFCDTWNREAHIAAKVARCYGRPWFPIFRPGEYVADALERAIPFLGCEAFFVHAHAAGLAEAIAAYRVDSLLNGTYVDSYLKGYCARDMIRVVRLGGLLPPCYRHATNGPAPQQDGWRRVDFSGEVLARWHERRQTLLHRFADPGRTSQTEWLELHPDLHGLATWPVERRVLPTRFVALDRRLIEFGFRCPVSLKLGNRIFLQAARGLYGKGAWIPNANDGVRPASGRGFHLAQRAARKLQDRVAGVSAALGWEPPIEHSWHDYHKYWRESTRLEELREQHGGNLDALNGAVFAASGAALVHNKHLHGEYGLRLLQLALWLSLVKESRSLAAARNVAAQAFIEYVGQTPAAVKGSSGPPAHVQKASACLREIPSAAAPAPHPIRLDP